MTNDIENVTNDAVNSTGSTANNTIAPVTPETPSALPPVVELQDISFIEKVGSGSYGVVYKAEWTRDSVQITVAVKEFSVGGEQKAFETEIKQLSRVQHPNIIALFGISGDSNTKYIIMEHAEGGSLHTFLHGNVKPYYSTAHAMSWARQCAEGVAYLHKMTPKPLIHRDLKPLNLLLTNKARLLKICDFGTVADKQTLMTNNKGSAAWMAPEVFEGSRYTEKCDIFSWAIVLWEVLSRQQPFREIDNTYQIMWKIHKGERPPLIKDCPKPIEKLMTSCWATLPDKRPSMQSVVAEMNELVSLFPGADEPIEYEFVNQQIILPDDSSNSAAVDGDNYTLDFSSFTSSYNNSTQRTPTNSSDFLTPTNSGGSILFNPHGEVPVIIWDAIPEQPDEELDHTPTGDNSGNIFNLTPSAETSQRNETIRNGMTQMGSIPMAPLPPLDIDPNAWDLNNGTEDSQASVPANGDIRDRLMVTTDARPILQHTTAPTGTTAGNDNNSRLNANCYDDNDNGYADADENDCETDQSLVDMLDPELQPEAPIANNAESLAIYREHQRLAKEYLRIDTKIYFALDFKEKLLINMDPAEREQKTTLLKKLKEKEELQSICNFLKSQVNANGAPPASDNRNSGSSVNELVSDDGWVVIPTNQNT